MRSNASISCSLFQWLFSIILKTTCICRSNLHCRYYSLKISFQNQKKMPKTSCVEKNTRNICFLICHQDNYNMFFHTVATSTLALDYASEHNLIFNLAQLTDHKPSTTTLILEPLDHNTYQYSTQYFSFQQQAASFYVLSFQESFCVLILEIDLQKTKIGSIVCQKQYRYKELVVQRRSTQEHTKKCRQSWSLSLDFSL